jgi:tetratricopeptide (TPR) repeat protein
MYDSWTVVLDGARPGSVHLETPHGDEGRGDASGACFQGADAAAALAALHAALRDAPRCTAGRLDEVLLGDRADLGDGVAFLRHVSSERDGNPELGVSSPPDADVFGALPASPAGAFTTDDPDIVARSVLLTHAFALPGGQALQLMSLRLLTSWCSDREDVCPPSAATLRAVFGADAEARVVLRAGGAATAAALDGVAVRDAAQLAPHRKAVAAALRAQVLHALRACLRARWAGGYVGLRRAAAPLLDTNGGGDSALRLTLEPLAMALLLARGGGGDLSGIRPLWHARAWQAEALEAAGRFDEASSLYAQNVEELSHAWRQPGARSQRDRNGLAVLLTVHTSYLGLARRRSGAHAEAVALYERALRHAESGAVALPVERESLRIVLLRLLWVVHDAAGNSAARDATYNRLFAPVFHVLSRDPEASVDGCVMVDFDNPRRDEYTATCVRTGRTFTTVSRPAPPDIVTELTHLDAIVELPGRAPPGVGNPGAFLPRADEQGEVDDPVRAPLRRDAAAQRLPRVPREPCAGCGAPPGGPAPLQRCAACLGVYYCSKACQAAHWRAHKRACRAARGEAA